MAEIAYILSVALAHAMTNLDNLIVIIIWAPLLGARRCVGIYFMTQAICIALSGMVGETAITVLGSWVSYLGVLPLSMGLIALRKQLIQGDETLVKTPNSAGAAAALFCGLGLDTIIVLSAIIGDSALKWHSLAYIGAATSLISLTALSLLIVARGFPETVVKRVNRFAPFAMIAVGIYVLSDSASDAQ